MPPQVVQRGRLSVRPQEDVAVVQPDEAPPGCHLPHLFVGEVAPVAADSPGVGVAGGKGVSGDRQKILKPLVVQVGHVHQDARPLQGLDSLPSETGQAVPGHAARADLVLPVPGEGDHPHPVPGQSRHPVQPASQGGAVFHSEDGRCLALSPGGLNVGGGAAGEGLGREGLHLPVKIALVQVVVGDSLLLGQAVRDENGTALAPAYPLRQGGQGEVPAGKVQGVGLPDPVGQSGEGIPPTGRVAEGVQQGGVLRPQGGEGVAVQVDKGVGIHGEAPFKVRINNKKL